MDPKNVNALTGKGLALYNLRNYTVAILYYNKALAIDSHHINALTGRAIS
jgi:tetratricopeptide (TPR) repeat protein